MKRETLRHPKTFDLAARLNCRRPEALGYLRLLWDFTADVAPRGDVGKHPDGAIAGACDWPGKADEFVAALVASRWIDLDPTHRLLIHDWRDHCERWVKLKLERLGLAFAEPTTERSIEATTEPSHSRDQTNPTLTKPTQTNPAACAADSEPATIPACLASEPFTSAWSEWMAYRRERRLSSRLRTMRAQLESLAPLGPQAATECVRKSIRNGWAGIFPEGKTNGGRKSTSAEYNPDGAKHDPNFGQMR